MPIEQSDNTRTKEPIIPPTHITRNMRVTNLARLQKDLLLNQDQLWDGTRATYYLNMLNFYNDNFWGNGVFGRQTNYNPNTPQGQAAIQSNFDYAKGNAQNFAGTLLAAGITEGIGQAIKWAITPTEIGSGAEAVVSSTPLSTQVTKVTTIPKAEMNIRNTVPGALEARYVGTSNGLTTYTQPKVRILSKEQISKAARAIDRIMSRAGWRKITHPNLLGAGYTNGELVVSDLGPGNIGRDWLGRLRLIDFSVETPALFRLSMEKQGGKIFNNS